MNNLNTVPDEGEEGTHHVEHNNEVNSPDGNAIENEKDVHEIESGNVGEPEAEKGMLSGPANDLIGQPQDKDDDE